MTASPLTIYLFGPLRILVHGALLPRVRTRSVEWLLALLALRHGRAVPRAWLAGTLWPESEERRALRNLRNDLARLRSALGSEAGRLQSPAPDALMLDLAGAEVDVFQFDQAVQAGDEGSLRRAVALYTGPLLEGGVEEWLLTEREARAEQCLTALETLAERAEGRQEHADAIRYLRRAEALDSLRDSLVRRLMANLAASGDPAAAIQVYRDFRSRLQAALIPGPDEATTRLFHAIRAAARRRATEGAREGQRERGSEGGRERQGEAGATPSLPHSLPPSLPRAVPRPLTPLIGREREVAEVREHLRQGRLVSLIGGGGVGKTRLALEVGALAESEYAGGAIWVELAPLADGALVLPSVAAALGLREAESRDAEPLEARLIARLADGAPLLVLDNCEHMLDVAAQGVQTLLQHCPDLHVLATSRQRLGLSGEVAYRVPSLPVPEPDDSRFWILDFGLGPGGADKVEQKIPGEHDAVLNPKSEIQNLESVMEYPAIRLFVARAAAAREGFQLASQDEAEAVCLICRRLDGIPLALELAAARVRMLTLRQIAARLDDRFRLLTTGERTRLARHQTLRAMIDWSYDQLPEAEARLLRQLAVFAGGWTLEGAEAICDFGFWILDFGLGEDASAAPGAATPSAIQNPKSKIQNPDVLDLLHSLEDRSLILVEERSGELRYRMLETVRAYTLEKLRERGEEESARARHLAWFLRLAEEVGPALRGPDPEAALDQLEAELDNLRAALRFSADEAGLRLGAALWPFWETRGYHSEGRHHLRTALQGAGLPGSAERAQALLGAARLAHHQHDMEEAECLGQESLAWFRARGDDRGMVTALFCLGETAAGRGKRAAAESLFTEGLEVSRRCGWAQGIALMLVRVGTFASIQGETARARPLLEEGRALAEALGDAPTLAVAFCYLALVAVHEGDDSRARPLLEQSLAIWRRLGNKGATAGVLTSLGQLAERQGDRTQAISSLEQAAATFRELGSRMEVVWRLLDLGSVHYRAATYTTACAAWEESLGRARELGHAYSIAAASNNLGMACFHLGDPDRAQALHREALALYHADGSAEGVVWALERLAVVTAAHGAPQEAARLLGVAAVAREEFGKASTDWEASDLEQAAAAVREQLGPAAWEATWEAGRVMRREQAIADALG